MEEKEEKIKQLLELEKQFQETELKKCKDKYYWLTRYAKTLDQHDKTNPIKFFPRKKYLWALIGLFNREDLLLIEKSRQMMMTWLFCALCLHEAQFNPGRFIFIQSKKEDDANSLVDRCKFIYHQQPDWMKQGTKPAESYCKFKFLDNNSQIVGIPQGGHQIRTHTGSIIFSDEAGFQPEFEDAYTAALPTVKGGGKFVAVSTAHYSPFWMELTHDPGEKKYVTNGIQKKHTSRGNCVVTLHYTADPVKRTVKWKDAEMLGFKKKGGGTDSKWKKEYEIDYEATGGTLVYEDLEKEEKAIFIEPFEIPKWWNRYGSIDPGTRNPTSVHFYAVDEHKRIFVYWELYEKELHYLQLCRTLEQHPDFKEVNKKGFAIDPASAQKISHSQFGIKSFQELLTSEGLNVYPGNNNRELGAEAIRKLIAENRLLIFNTCPKMWWELTRLRYEEWKGDRAEKNIKEAIVAKDDHAWSDLRYFVLSPYSKSKKPVEGIEAKIKKMHKKRSTDFNKLYSV